MEGQAFSNEDIDQALTDLFFGCNIPFHTVESVQFKNFVHALNPKYVPPTRKTLANRILDQRFDMLQNSIVSINPKDAVLLLDGWKNSSSNKKYVVALLHLSNGKYIYLDSWNFSTIRETGQALSDVVNQCIIMAQQSFNFNVYAVIIDNASNMVAMGRAVSIWHVTCNSHSGNLLCKSLIDKQFATKVNNLLKEFKYPALESLLVDLGGHRIILAGETRWCSYRDSFRRCLQNLDSMRQIAYNHEIEIKNEHAELLRDPTIEIRLLVS